MSTQSATAPQCCLCGNWLQFGSKPLYGYQVCPKCHSDFAWKRTFAYLIDIVIINAVVGVLIVIALIIGAVLVGVAQSAKNDDAATAGAVVFLFMYAGVFLCAYAMNILRDGFNGMSPGKRILGLQVINTVNGVPIRFGDSLKRNLVLIVPVLPIVVAVQIFTANGMRIGDEWAQTKVIWLQYADRAPFLSLSGIQAQARARAAAAKAAQPPVTNQPQA
jgi:uncharacterized RDD family membrane protein YckC